MLSERVIPPDELGPGHEDVLVAGEQAPQLGPVLAAVLRHGGPHLVPELALPVWLDDSLHDSLVTAYLSLLHVGVARDVEDVAVVVGVQEPEEEFLGLPDLLAINDK